MNYSTDTSTATTTPRLRTLQSLTSTASSGLLLSNNNNIHHLNNNNNNQSINNNTNNYTNNNTLINNPLKKTNFFTYAHQAFNNIKNKSPPNNNNNIFDEQIMMSSNDGISSNSSSNNKSNLNGKAKMSADMQTKIGEIEPLLSSSISATISPMHETYNANQTTIIIHENDNNKDAHQLPSSLSPASSSSSSSSTVHLNIDTPSSSKTHHRNHNGLNLHNHHRSHNFEGDLIHSSNEEESSLLSNTDFNLNPQNNHTVMRTQSSKNTILLNLLSFLFVSLNMILNLLVISVIHERIPMEQPHLPDIAFDILPDHRHFLDIAEYVIVIQSFCIGVLLFFHKYRSIILRRICIIMGIIYFFRALCLSSTQLPLASKNYHCSPQLKNSTEYANATSLEFIEIIIYRVFYMSLGMGLSINGHHTFCGDYIFSGHTVILVLCYLIQKEYLLPSRRRTLAWKCVDIIQIVMTVTSIVCILIARGHYFIDIIIAYFVTTRIFWMYHTLCNFSAINIRSTSNHLNRVWWWPIFVYLENIRTIPIPTQSSQNHYNLTKHHNMKIEDNQVQRIFEWPLPWPKRFVRKKHHRSEQFTA